MRGGTIGLIAALALGIVAAPLAAGSQPRNAGDLLVVVTPEGA